MEWPHQLLGRLYLVLEVVEAVVIQEQTQLAAQAVVERVKLELEHPQEMVEL